MMKEVFSGVYFIIPPMIILFAQVYVAKHNLLYQKIQKLEKVASDILDKIDGMCENDINNLKQKDLAKIFYVKRSFQDLRDRHTCFLKNHRDEISVVCGALEEVYNIISDDEMSDKKRCIHEKYIIIFTNITKIL